MNPMDIPIGDDVQSWVLNRLPLSSEQKWELIQTLKKEKCMPKEEVEELNKQSFIDNEEYISQVKQELQKREQLREQELIA